jgi:hypothetical protein
VVRGQRGSATIEHAALVLLAAVIAVASVSGARLLNAEGRTPALVSELLRKQRCAVRYSDPCWQDPLTEAYGRAIAGAVRALAPAPAAVRGLVGIDYRRCRRASCAIPLPSPAGGHLTVSNRRTTSFTALREKTGAPSTVEYWIYRPTIGWELITRRLDEASIKALAGTALGRDQDPRLVPLETLLGRDQADFPPAEEPPWRHTVESRWGR